MDRRRKDKKLKLLKLLHSDSPLSREHKLLRVQLRDSVWQAQAAQYAHFWREHEHPVVTRGTIIHPPVPDPFDLSDLGV